jgi:hypothetical protein
MFLHNLLNVLVQIANKMEFKQNMCKLVEGHRTAGSCYFMCDVTMLPSRYARLNCQCSFMLIQCIQVHVIIICKYRTNCPGNGRDAMGLNLGRQLG